MRKRSLASACPRGAPAGVFRHSEMQGCECRHSLRRISPGRYVAGLLALRNSGSEGVFGTSSPFGCVWPQAGPRRERGQERAELWPADPCRGHGSGWDAAGRSRGFRSTLKVGAEDLQRCLHAMRQAVPVSETAMLGSLAASSSIESPSTMSWQESNEWHDSVANHSGGTNNKPSPCDDGDGNGEK